MQPKNLIFNTLDSSRQVPVQPHPQLDSVPKRSMDQTRSTFKNMNNSFHTSTFNEQGQKPPKHVVQHLTKNVALSPFVQSLQNSDYLQKFMEKSSLQADTPVQLDKEFIEERKSKFQDYLG